MVIMGVTEGITKVITRVEAAAAAMEEETVMTTEAIVRVVASQLFFLKWWMDAAELTDLCLQVTVEVEETTTTWATTNPSHPTLVR